MMSASKTPLLSTSSDDDPLLIGYTGGSTNTNKFPKSIFAHNACLCILTVLEIALTIIILESHVPCDNISMGILWSMNALSLITVWSLYNIKLSIDLDSEEGDWLEKKGNFRLAMLLGGESFICLFSPNHRFGQDASPLFNFNTGVALCVFIRLYNFLRLLRDLDPLYIRRSEIRRQLIHMNLLPPRFDWLFSLKRLVHDRGFFFCSFTFLLQLCIFSYVMFSVERNQDDMICNALEEENCWDDFWLVVWFCASTITTVGYGDMVPSTGLGRMISIIMCCAGVVLLGFIYSIVSQSLKVTEKGLAALEVAKLQELNEKRLKVNDEKRKVIDRKIEMVEQNLQDNVNKRLERIEIMLRELNNK
ncbi:hypothetical protein TrLO_g14361 [Triparma laevis f. longispina]|uniref:Potassium channel domain-containing protein n=1 Tax=Triparma laevis f. longispina TaxID=1714387 RepID=A0A9W7L0G5_9STRA|nr:hypothetical protein TrLO_g14361 [Triparma laevis f. longispina]